MQEQGLARGPRANVHSLHSLSLDLTVSSSSHPCQEYGERPLALLNCDWPPDFQGEKGPLTVSSFFWFMQQFGLSAFPPQHPPSYRDDQRSHKNICKEFHRSGRAYIINFQ